MTTNHECPAPGCEKTVPFHIFACKQHWYTISTPARRELLREFRDNFGTDSYFQARARCLAELGWATEAIPLENAGVGLTPA